MSNTNSIFEINIVKKHLALSTKSMYEHFRKISFLVNIAQDYRKTIRLPEINYFLCGALRVAVVCAGGAQRVISKEQTPVL